MCQDRLGKDKEDHMGEHTVVAVDIAKSVFEVAVSKQPGSSGLKRRLGRIKREGLLPPHAPDPRR